MHKEKWQKCAATFNYRTRFKLVKSRDGTAMSGTHGNKQVSFRLYGRETDGKTSYWPHQGCMSRKQINLSLWTPVYTTKSASLCFFFFLMWFAFSPESKKLFPLMSQYKKADHLETIYIGDRIYSSQSVILIIHPWVLKGKPFFKIPFPVQLSAQTR